MVKTIKPAARTPDPSRVLGRDVMLKLNAVEGLALSPGSESLLSKASNGADLRAIVRKAYAGR